MTLQTYSGGDQWIRRWSLSVQSSSGTVLELSAGYASALGGQTAATGPRGEPLSEGLRMKFRTVSAEIGIPNHAEIWVYNLAGGSGNPSPGQPNVNTAARLINMEFATVIVQAGYSQGAYGVIFKGTIKNVKRGKENATDSYIIIYASDGDFWFTQHADIVGQYMQRGSDIQQRFTATIDEAKKNGGLQIGTVNLGQFGTGGILPRGKIQWGLGNFNMDTTSQAYYRWSVQNGALQILPQNEFLSNEAVVLNVHSGLIGQPEATADGVYAVALLNPKVKVGCAIKINNGDINTTEPAVAGTTTQQIGYPGVTDINFFASISDDGTYKVYSIEYEGDTRGNEWYMKLGMLLIDPGTSKVVGGFPASPPTQIGGTQSGTGSAPGG